jgi:PKHD-type hydroxylase
MEVEMKMEMEMYSDFIEFKEHSGLDNYYYFEESFSEDDLQKVDELIKRYADKLDDGIVSNRLDKSYRRSKISWVPLNDDTKWLYRKIGSLVSIANNDLWNFDIVGMSEMLQYGEYHDSEGGHYDWHMDLGGNVTNRKISVTIQLSDPEDYEGGELQFMTSRKIRVAPKGKGFTVIFPSYFLHRVTEVTRGIRRSLVIWVSGNPFR